MCIHSRHDIMDKEGSSPRSRGFPSLGLYQLPLNKLTNRLMIALARLITAVTRLIFSLSILMFSPPLYNSIILYFDNIIKRNFQFSSIKSSFSGNKNKSWNSACRYLKTYFYVIFSRSKPTTSIFFSWIRASRFMSSMLIHMKSLPSTENVEACIAFGKSWISATYSKCS